MHLQNSFKITKNDGRGYLVEAAMISHCGNDRTLSSICLKDESPCRLPTNIQNNLKSTLQLEPNLL